MSGYQISLIANHMYRDVIIGDNVPSLSSQGKRETPIPLYSLKISAPFSVFME